MNNAKLISKGYQFVKRVLFVVSTPLCVRLSIIIMEHTSCYAVELNMIDLEKFAIRIPIATYLNLRLLYLHLLDLENKSKLPMSTCSW